MCCVCVCVCVCACVCLCLARLVPPSPLFLSESICKRAYATKHNLQVQKYDPVRQVGGKNVPIHFLEGRASHNTNGVLLDPSPATTSHRERKKKRRKGGRDEGRNERKQNSPPKPPAREKKRGQGGHIPEGKKKKKRFYSSPHRAEATHFTLHPALTQKHAYAYAEPVTAH